MKESTTRLHPNPTRPAAFQRETRRRAASLPGPKVLASLSQILQLELDKHETNESSACEAPSLQDSSTPFRFLSRRSRSYTPETQDFLLTGCGTHVSQLALFNMPMTIEEDIVESQESHASALIDELSIPSCSHLHHDVLAADYHLPSGIDTDSETLVDTTESQTLFDEPNHPLTVSKATCHATTDDIDNAKSESRTATDEDTESPNLIKLTRNGATSDDKETIRDLYDKKETAPLVSSPRHSVHDDVQTH